MSQSNGTDENPVFSLIDLPEITDFEDEGQIEAYIKAAKSYFPENLKEYKRIKIPEVFESDEAEIAFQLEQIKRCKKGWDGMCGKQYFYFNFCKITSNRGGSIYPEYRVADEIWFKVIESCRVGEINEGKGVICVKRRRAGFSWKAAADALHDALFSKDVEVGMNSKTEEDGIQLFKKVKYIFDRLPDFLKMPAQGGNTRESIFFARKEKDKYGNAKLSGNMSTVYCVPPTDSAYEGRRLNKWICDESGKLKNLKTLWVLTEDCLNDEKGRSGVPILFGTAGDMDKVSMGLKDLWISNDIYDLVRFFMPGWAGKEVDACGNDKIELQVRRIVDRRRKLLRSGSREYFEEIQKQPLTVSEALQSKVVGGVGNIKNIKEQITRLEKNPVIGKKGLFRKVSNQIVFEPVSMGNSGVEFHWTIYEEPKQGYKGLYLAGTDPVDSEGVNMGEASEASMYIMQRGIGSEPKRIVATCTGRSKKLDDWYDQAIMAQVYFDRCKNLIEANRYGMIKYYEIHGHLGLLKEEPIPRNRLKRNYVPRIGGRKTKDTESEMRRLINEYTDDFCDLIPEIELLEEFLKFGSQNTDRAIAFAWALIHDEDLKTDVKTGEVSEHNGFKFGYKKVNGKIVSI